MSGQHRFTFRLLQRDNGENFGDEKDSGAREDYPAAAVHGEAMTIDQLQRAALFGFAYQQAIHTGSLPAMRAVAYIVRNRVLNGWHDGNWLQAIQLHREVSGNEPTEPPLFDVYSQVFQLFLRQIDDIYFGQGDETRHVVDKALYWQFIDKPLRPWFTDNVLHQPNAHPRRAIIGSMYLFD